MSSVVRAALTETKNAYPNMPARVDELDQLAGDLEKIHLANLDHHETLIRAARAQGAQLIGLGELFTGPYFALELRPFWDGLAEDASTGPTAQRMRSLAKELSMVIVAPIFEREAKNDQRFNTALVFDADGTLLGGYRKAHIPHGKNEQAQFVEIEYYQPSDGGLVAGGGDDQGGRIISKDPYFPVFQTGVGKLGVAICYDRHFEGVMRSLARGGAEIVLSPAVTFGEKSERMWTLEFPTDAARHNLFIGGSNRKGKEAPWDVEYFGNSAFYGPSGRRLENLSTEPRLIISDLDREERKDDGSGWDLQRDCRLDIYAR